MLALNDRSDDLSMRDASTLDRRGADVFTSDEPVTIRMPSFLQLVKAGFAVALGASLMAVIGWFVWLTFILAWLTAFLRR